MKKNIYKNIKIFADGANFDEMINLSNSSFIKGLTTNPSLMKKNKVKNYEEFAKKVLKKIKKKPISFEVFSDDLEGMKQQAEIINSWGKNVYVKIPITNTKNISTVDVIKYLSDKSIKLNITAIMTVDQVKKVLRYLNPQTPSYISIFAGRIADTGRDPLPMMTKVLRLMKKHKKSELIWASTREVYNILQASKINCHIITVTTDVLKKISLNNYNLDKYSLDTVKSFRQDALKSNYLI